MKLQSFKEWWNQPSTPEQMKILWDVPYNEYYEDIGNMKNVVCHDVTLECGHKATYRHTGIRWPFMECKECIKSGSEKTNEN